MPYYQSNLGSCEIQNYLANEKTNLIVFKTPIMIKWQENTNSQKSILAQALFVEIYYLR